MGLTLLTNFLTPHRCTKIEGHLQQLSSSMDFFITPPARRAWRSYKFASLRFSVFFPVTSWATAHGWYRCAVYRLLSEPMSTRLLNSISTGTCRQNTQFNMYSTTSKQQEGCTFKDSHPKCLITTNFDKFLREAVAKRDESRWSFDSMFPW